MGLGTLTMQVSNLKLNVTAGALIDSAVIGMTIILIIAAIALP
jgi:hypothetical protein